MAYRCTADRGCTAAGALLRRTSCAVKADHVPEDEGLSHMDNEAAEENDAEWDAEESAPPGGEAHLDEAEEHEERAVVPIKSARKEEKAPVPIELVGKSATERQEKKVKDDNESNGILNSVISGFRRNSAHRALS